MLTEFFRKMTGGKTDSGQIAKKRLQIALIYDQLEISDDLLQQLNRDIVEVISRYFEIDKSATKLDIRREEGSSALIVNTPILSARICRRADS